jgi:phosphatidylserine decarboxylase
MKKNYGSDRSWPFAEGGGETILIILVIFALVVLLWLFLPGSLLVDVVLFIAALVAFVVLYFFRDPNRQIARQAGIVLSPGDGKIVSISREHESLYLQDTAVRVSIFLSVLDIHVQRVPIDGKVLRVDHKPGRFLQAFKPEASDVNEYIAMLLETSYGRVLVKQIAGILARRCVNYAEVGETVRMGDRFGLIKFSSRVDLFLPVQAEILVKEGEQVYAGLTPLARLTVGDNYGD